jgi:hypothetical protein
MNDNQRQPVNISLCDNPVVRDTLRYFCRHLVCLGGTVQDLDESGRKKGAKRSFACSAFVLVIRDIWYLLTAGHCMKDIEKGQKKGRFRLVDTYLMSGFGPEVKEHHAASMPISFDYENTWKDFIDEDGLDFGLLKLGSAGDYLRMHLERNEVEPVREENWRVPPGLHFDLFAVLGFPEQFVALGELRPAFVPCFDSVAVKVAS